MAGPVTNIGVTSATRRHTNPSRCPDFPISSMSLVPTLVKATHLPFTALKSMSSCVLISFYGIPANRGNSYVNLVMKVIAPVLQDRASFVEVKPDSEKEYNENLHEKIATTIFNTSCSSVRKYIPSYVENIYIYLIFTCWQYFIDYKSQKNWFIYPWNSFVMWYATHWSRSDDWTYDVSWLMKPLTGLGPDD